MAGEIFNALRGVNEAIAGRQANALGAIRNQYAPQMMAQEAEKGDLELQAARRANSPEIQQAQQIYAAAQQVLASPTPAALVHNAFPEIEAQLRAAGHPIDTDEQAKEAAQYVAAHYGSMLAGMAGKPELPGFVQQNQQKPSALEAAYQTHVQQSKARGVAPMPFFDNSGNDFVSNFARAQVGAPYGTPQSVPGVGVVTPSKVTGQVTTTVPEPVVQAGIGARAGAEASGKILGTGQAERTLDLPAAQARVASIEQKMDRLRDSVDEILKDENLWKAVGLGKGLSMIPGTAGADIKAKISALQSQAGLSVLQDMRDNSKSGGAVGQVSNFEQQIFQNYLAALGDLNQSPEAYRKQLEKVKAFAESSKDRFRNAFEQTYPGIKAKPSTAPVSAFDPSKMSDAELQRLINGQ